MEENKDLLLKDLSARLPYHVKVKVWLKDGTTEEGLLDLKHNYGDVLRDAFYYNKIVDIKPYLRPMYSMTEEEEKEYKSFLFTQYHEWDGHSTYTNYVEVDKIDKYINWLNAHHFDYRGLIPKGLAIEVTEGMYG